MTKRKMTLLVAAIAAIAISALVSHGLAFNDRVDRSIAISLFERLIAFAGAIPMVIIADRGRGEPDIIVIDILPRCPCPCSRPSGRLRPGCSRRKSRPIFRQLRFHRTRRHRRVPAKAGKQRQERDEMRSSHNGNGGALPLPLQRTDRKSPGFSPRLRRSARPGLSRQM